MRWRALPRFTGMTLTMVPATRAALPECWLSGDGGREIRFLGSPEADLDLALEVWLWFTGMESVELTGAERDALQRATAVRPVARASERDRARLAVRLGARRARREKDRWAVWSIPVTELEEVLSSVLTRSGRRHPPIVA